MLCNCTMLGMSLSLSESASQRQPVSCSGSHSDSRASQRAHTQWCCTCTHNATCDPVHTGEHTPPLIIIIINRLHLDIFHTHAAVWMNKLRSRRHTCYNSNHLDAICHYLSLREWGARVPQTHARQTCSLLMHLVSSRFQTPESVRFDRFD